MIRSFFKSDQVGGLIWFVLGIGLCIGSIRLTLGEFHYPGPGFMPFLSGALLGLFGLVLIFAGISKRLREGEKVEVEESLQRFVSIGVNNLTDHSTLVIIEKGG